MWIAVIAVILAIALAVGPIMMLQPSPRQKTIARLRAQASKNHLNVRLQPNLAGDSPKLIPVYSLTLESGIDSPINNMSWVLIRKSFEHDIHFSKTWDWKDKDSSKSDGINLHGLKEFLAQLPKSVVAVQQEGKVIALHWTEALPQGETPDDSVQRINLLLQQLKALVKPPSQADPSLEHSHRD